MTTITTIAGGDLISASRSVINANFSNLNAGKLEVDAEGSIAINSAKFDLTPAGTAETGELYWDATEETLSFKVNSVTTMNIGQEEYVKVVNKTGVQINDGQAVYLSGAQGNRPTASLAKADANATAFMIGVATENIANNAEWFVTVSGLVHGFDTSGYVAWDVLYVSASTAGAITNVAPVSPNYVVVIGRALDSTANGHIGVFPQQPIDNDNALGTDQNVAPSQNAVKTYVDGNIPSGWNATRNIGYLNIPQNSQSTNYTIVLADSGKHIYHPSADTTARTWTIPANASVAFPIGTAVTFVNDTSAGALTIAITTDTLVLSPAGTTGSRTLAANGMATAIKVTSTRWMISGGGLT